MRSLGKFLYTHNPFYLISAACVSYGVRVAFYEPGAEWINAWRLAESLAGYTFLLALTACLIVRLGKVWDDARTIALLVVLMTASISVGFDALSMNDNQVASQVMVCGWVFSVAIVEFLIRGLGLRFPAAFRLPLYAVFGLFFFYPLYLGQSVWLVDKMTMTWRVFAFPILAAALTFSLIPAARMGTAWVVNQNSPWRWPYYPWSVFFFLAVGVCGRSYLMTVSFQTEMGLDSSFGAYYLIPFAFAVLWVAAEASLQQGNLRLLGGLAWVPVALLGVVSWHPTNQPYGTFLKEFTEVIASPLSITLAVSLAFSATLWLRGSKSARIPFFVFVLLTGVVNTRTQSLLAIEVQPHAWIPCLLVGCFHLVQLRRHQASLRFLQAWCALVGAACLYDPDYDVLLYWGVLQGHVVALGLLIAGYAYRDYLALRLRTVLPMILLLTALIAAGIEEPPGVPAGTALTYVAGLAALAAVLWWVARAQFWKCASLGCTALWIVAMLVESIREMHQYLPSRAVQALAAGTGCFLVGGLISAAKGGGGFRTGGFLRKQVAALTKEWCLAYAANPAAVPEEEYTPKLPKPARD